MSFFLHFVKNLYYLNSKDNCLMVFFFFYIFGQKRGCLVCFRPDSNVFSVRADFQLLSSRPDNRPAVLAVPCLWVSMTRRVENIFTRAPHCRVGVYGARAVRFSEMYSKITARGVHNKATTLRRRRLSGGTGGVISKGGTGGVIAEGGTRGRDACVCEAGSWRGGRDLEGRCGCSVFKDHPPTGRTGRIARGETSRPQPLAPACSARLPLARLHHRSSPKPPPPPPPHRAFRPSAQSTLGPPLRRRAAPTGLATTTTTTTVPAHHYLGTYRR